MMPQDVVEVFANGSPPLGDAGQIAGVWPSLLRKNRLGVAAVAIALVALTLPLGGCALFLAGAAGAVVEHELDRPRYAPPGYYAVPRGYHYCFAAGGGPPILCRNRR
jgi:hypothetical protein